MLLEAALAVFIRRGYAATMGEMARHARCSPGLFYAYFPSKQALLESIAMQQLNELFEMTVARMRASAASVSSLREGLRVMAAHVAQRQAAFRLLVQAVPVWRAQGNGAAAHTSVMQDFVALTSDLLQESQRAGLVRTDVSAAELQAFIHLVCLGLIERVATAPDEPQAEKLAALAWELLCCGIHDHPQDDRSKSPGPGTHPGSQGAGRADPRRGDLEQDSPGQAVSGFGARELNGDFAASVAERQPHTGILRGPFLPPAPAARMSPPCAHPVGPHDDGSHGRNGGSLLSCKAREGRGLAAPRV